MSTAYGDAGIESVRPQPAHPASALTSVVLAAAVADVVLIVAGIRHWLPPSALLALHLGLLPLVWLGGRFGDPTYLALAMISILLMGPVGALGTLAMIVLLSRRRTPDEASLATWHRTLAEPNRSDLSQRLAQAIDEGRLRPPTESVPVAFGEVSRRGTAAQRQTMLGLVSQHYEPRFGSLLRQELRSEDTAVRVSAAAVFSKLRETNRQRMGSKGPLPALIGPAEAVARATALARGVMSGLLDPADLVSARDRSLDLFLMARPYPTVADEVEELIATLLFDAGRHDALLDRLDMIDPGTSGVLRGLHARLLMKAGRTAEAADMIRHREKLSVRLNAIPRPDGSHPLLSHGRSQGERS